MRLKITTINLILLLVVLVQGCQTAPPRSITQQELEGQYISYLKEYKQVLDSYSSRSFQRIKKEYIESTAVQPQSYDVLILSGGGAFGAFGIGFLDGWGSIENGAQSRPHFDTVSGVSTGAMIAPFVFINTPEAYKTITDIYKNPEVDWVQKRGLIPFLPSNVSIFDVTKLHDKIRSTVTPELVNTLAKEYRNERQLLVGTTNVDYGLMRVWDLAKNAHDEPISKAIDKISKIVFASSAIPGAFPPISIDEMLYVDGGASMQIVSGIDNRDWAYTGDTGLFDFVKDNEPVKIRIWVIVNQKLLSEPTLISTDWPTIAQRSLSTLIRTSTLQALQDMETYIRLIQKYPKISAEMRYVAIPQDFEIPNSDEMFDAETMRRLMNKGREMGKDFTSWKSEALSPGAPFEIVN